MKRTIPVKNSPLKPQFPFMMQHNPKNANQAVFWQMIHQKSLRVAGRGGKGHFIGGSKGGWNRKGRW